MGEILLFRVHGGKKTTARNKSCRFGHFPVTGSQMLDVIVSGLHDNSCLLVDRALLLELSSDEYTHSSIAKISVMSPIVINMPTRELLAYETKNSFV